MRTFNAHQVYADVFEGVVKNVSVGDFGVTDQIAKERWGADAVAINVTQIPVQIGDTYKDGVFYRDGVEIEVLLTAEQAATQALSLANQAIASADYVTMMSGFDTATDKEA